MDNDQQENEEVTESGPLKNGTPGYFFVTLAPTELDQLINADVPSESGSYCVDGARGGIAGFGGASVAPTARVLEAKLEISHPPVPPSPLNTIPLHLTA